MLLSEVEQELCANPNNRFEWLAVDASGGIFAHEFKPVKAQSTWQSEGQEELQGTYTGGLEWRETLRLLY